jgi:EthD domain
VLGAIGAEGESDGVAMDFDGFSECWFADRAAFELAMSSREWLRMNEDAEELFDLDYVVPAMSAVLAEYVVLERAGDPLPA